MTKMTKKLIQHGNSLALIIDKPILNMLNISAETQLCIRTDGTNIIIEPVVTKKKPTFSSKKLLALHEELIRLYGEDFRKLAQ